MKSEMQIYVLICLNIYFAACKISCKYDMAKITDPDNRPLLTKKSGTMIHPSDSREIEIEDGKAVTLHCLSNDGKETNKFRGIGTKNLKEKDLLHAKCREGTWRVRMKNRRKRLPDLDTLTCHRKIRPFLESDLNRICYDLTAYGKPVDEKSAKDLKHFVATWGEEDNQISWCVHEEKKRTLWGSFTIRENTELGDDPGNFSETADPTTMILESLGILKSTKKLYKWERQILAMESLGTNNKITVISKGSSLTERDIVDGNFYLVPGLLALLKFFIWRYEQLATLVLLNTVPLFKPIVEGNQEMLAAQLLALSSSGKELKVWSIPDGQLTYPNKEGNLERIFLDPKNKRLPVPAGLWYLVLYEKTILNHEAMAFFLLNNPHETKESQDKLQNLQNRCGISNCADHGWHFTESFEAGQVVCCTLEDFMAETSFRSYGKKVEDYSLLEKKEKRVVNTLRRSVEKKN